MSEQSRAKYEKIEKLIKSGETVVNACKEAGASTPTFYQWRIKMGVTKKPRRKKLKVIDLPQAVGTGQAFIVFGSPSALAEFARSYQ